MRLHKDQAAPLIWREVGYIFANGEILRVERCGAESRTVRLDAI